jgi:hypothetical protein
MDKETAIVTKLKTALPTTPITIAEKPNKVDSCVVFFQVSGVPDHTQSGNTGISKDRFQFDCWGKSLNEAKSLADVVIGALDCIELPDFNINYLESYTAVKDLETGLWRVILEFMVW